jgi:hypothetical protein
MFLQIVNDARYTLTVHWVDFSTVPASLVELLSIEPEEQTALNSYNQHQFLIKYKEEVPNYFGVQFKKSSIAETIIIRDNGYELTLANVNDNINFERDDETFDSPPDLFVERDVQFGVYDDEKIANDSVGQIPVKVLILN